MSKTTIWSIAIATFVLATIVYTIHTIGLFRQEMPKLQPSPAPVISKASAPAIVQPKAHYEIPAEPDSVKKSNLLPTLQVSDRAILDALEVLLGKRTITDLFYADDVVRHIVVTIDNLPREREAVQLRPVKPIGGEFLTTSDADVLHLSRKNSERYRAYAHIVQMIDAKQLVALYVRFYPLFQQAYQDLGYPKGYFNDRLIEVIDHLIDAPELYDTIRLVQPHVSYKFSDEELEKLSAGDKIMIRIGIENEEIVKNKLREIRKELTKAAK